MHRSLDSPETLLLDCQSVLYSNLSSRFVIPLVPVDMAPVALPRVNPTLSFAGERYILMTDQAATIRVAGIGPPVGDLADEHYAVTRAIDALLSGF